MAALSFSSERRMYFGIFLRGQLSKNVKLPGTTDNG